MQGPDAADATVSRRPVRGTDNDDYGLCLHKVRPLEQSQETKAEDEMNETEMRELDAWIFKRVLLGKIVSKRFKMAKGHRLGWKIRIGGQEIPQSGGLHGWGWLSCRDSAKHAIPNYTISNSHALAVLEKCAVEKSIAISICKIPRGGWSVFHGAYRAEAETLPLAICLFAKKLFS